jgi:hypothetical protein
MLDAIHEHIVPLKGYSIQRSCSAQEIVRRNKEGI